MVFCLNAVELEGCATFTPSPKDLADELEAAHPADSAFGSGIPIPEGLSMAGMYERGHRQDVTLLHPKLQP